MEFIHKLITKNPINDITMGRIKDRVKQVLSVFIKNYAKKTNLVIVEQKENDYKEKEKRKSIIKNDNDKKIKYFIKMYGEEAEVPNFPELPEKDASVEDKFSYCKLMLDLGFKPLFPRGKYEPLRPLELRVEVIRYVIKDPEYEPYATYIIKATKGKKVVEKERTFKVFEKLNLCLKKILIKDCVFPSASSKIAAKNITQEFLNKSVIELNDYIQSVLGISDIEDNKDFQFFTGFSPTDPLDDKIFEAALRKTKWDLGLWVDIKYDAPQEAISKLIKMEIFKEFRNDIYIALPNSESSRKASLKLANKLISGEIDIAVPPAWDAAYCASKKIRPLMPKVLDVVIPVLIEKKIAINEKLNEKIMEYFIPIKEAIGKLFSEAFKKIVLPLIEPFAICYKTYTVVSEPLIIEGLRNGDKDKIKEAINIMNKCFLILMLKLNKIDDGQLKDAYKELNDLVKLEVMKDCLLPIRAIGKIISDFISIINPEHWLYVVNKVIEYKKRLYDCKKEGVDKILYEMERYLHWEIYSRTIIMDTKSYSLKYNLYELSLDSIADICLDLGRNLIKQVYKKSCKKFYRKFSDFVWGFSMKKTDDKSWNERVDEALILAYELAKHKFNKECGNIIKRCICDIFGGGEFLFRVNELIFKQMDNYFKALNDMIPENVKEMIDIEEMTNNCIQEVLISILEGAVNELKELFVEELIEAIDNYKI